MPLAASGRGRSHEENSIEPAGYAMKTLCGLWCVVMVAAAAVGGCGGPGAPASGNETAPGGQAVAPAEKAADQTPQALDAVAEPVDGDWIVANLPAEMENLNPFTSSDLYSGSITGLAFDRLLQRDNATLELKPMLAESWEISDDKLTYTFHVRPDAMFSDGVPLTARDVKFSFDKLMDPNTNAPHVRNYYQDVTACDLIDDYTVRFTCNKPYFKHLGVLGGLEVIPEHIYGQGDFNNHPNNRNPIGSGPYILESWETAQQVVLVRNENYWGKKPWIKKRVFKIITNADAALQVLLRGELDSMDLTAEQWKERTGTAAFRDQFIPYEYYEPSYIYIGWNMRRPKFSDKTVRRALTMLLDRELIRDEIYYGLARITTGPFFVDEPEYNKAIQPWPFDPAQAAALLDAAGWKDTNSDGVRDKVGEPFAFELLITNSSTVAEQIATIYQEDLKRAGIAMTIRQLEWATFLESVKSHNYDACALGWGAVPDPDPYQVWHSSQAVVNGSNAVGFVNEEADRILEEARLEFDRDKRVAMYHRFHEILHEEQPYTFMFCRKTLVAVHKRFQNVTVYPYGLDSQEWWVPLDMQKYK